MSLIAYVAASIDGYIADKKQGLDWLNTVPNPSNHDFGFAEFMQTVDALIMGRNTFEMVDSFDCEWPYSKPVFVISNTLQELPEKYQNKAFLVKGEIIDIIASLKKRGLNRLYIDGGVTIQHCLKHDLIDELIITTIPVILGGGVPLFGELKKPLHFKHIKSTSYLNSIVQNHFVRHQY